MKRLLFEKAAGILEVVPERDYQVLDFGCGNGDFLGTLSRRIGPNSRMVGYDAMGESIAIAQERHPDAEFICERFAEKLPFQDASFDVFSTIDTLECIKNKDALLTEIHRVLKPGGEILTMHWDWDTQAYNIPSRELARKAVQAFSDWKQPWMDEADGQMGRKLWGLFEGGGKFHGRPDAFCLIETEYEAGQYGFDRAQDLSGVVASGGLKEAEYDQFLREVSESSEKGEYFYSVTSFIYHGRRV